MAHNDDGNNAWYVNTGAAGRPEITFAASVTPSRRFPVIIISSAVVMSVPRCAMDAVTSNAFVTDEQPSSGRLYVI